MSDSEDSTVTYTTVSSLFSDLPDIGSPRVDGPPVMPEDPYTYVPVYPEFMPPKDEILLAEEQPLPAAVSPTTDSPGYVPESDPEEDPEENDDEDPEEDPADGGDDGDDEDESSDDKDVDIGGALIHKNRKGSKQEGRRIHPTIGGFGGNCASNQSSFNNGRIEEWEEKKKEDRVSTTKIFRSKILIKNSVCSLIIDGCSINNLVSRKLVDFLKLPMEICPIEGYQVCRVLVTIGKSYKIEVLCIVDDIDECHILLGRPWQCEVNGKYDLKKNLYLFSWEGRRIAMVSPKVTPQLPNSEVKVEEKIVKAEVVDEHIEKIQDLQNYKQQDDKISTSLFETTNKVGTLKTYEEIVGFNDDEDDWSSLKTLPEVRNNKVVNAFQEEDELEYAEHLDGKAEQVTYVIQRTLCSPK
ncbi:hypothetical protein Tco_1054476, partial [Tanacetum coccineum]